MKESHTGIQDIMIPQQGVGLNRDSPHPPDHYLYRKLWGRIAIQPHALFKIIKKPDIYHVNRSESRLFYGYNLMAEENGSCERSEIETGICP